MSTIMFISIYRGFNDVINYTPYPHFVTQDETGLP